MCDREKAVLLRFEEENDIFFDERKIRVRADAVDVQSMGVRLDHSRHYDTAISRCAMESPHGDMIIPNKEGAAAGQLVRSLSHEHPGTPVAVVDPSYVAWLEREATKNEKFRIYAAAYQRPWKPPMCFCC